MPPRPTTAEELQTRFKALAKELGAILPDLEAIAVICSWKPENQESFPRMLYTRADDEPIHIGTTAKLAVQQAIALQVTSRMIRDQILSLDKVSGEVARRIDEQLKRLDPTGTTPTSEIQLPPQSPPPAPFPEVQGPKAG